MRKLRDLPNKEGYKFIGVCKDDTLLFCEVGKDKTGLHCAYDSETNEKCYYRLKGWFQNYESKYRT